MEKYRRPGTLITLQHLRHSHHTSDGRKAEAMTLKKHFCGTHFFNPPRYLRLLENHSNTPYRPRNNRLPDALRLTLCWGQDHGALQRTRPAFIANRIGVCGIMAIFGLVEKMGLGIDREIDALTGPSSAVPNPATFRTARCSRHRHPRKSSQRSLAGSLLPYR